MGATSRRFKVIASHPSLNAEVKPFVQKLRSIVKKKKIAVLSTGSMPPAIPEVECDLSGLVEAISLLRLEIIYIIDRCDFVSVGFVLDGVLHSSKLVSDSDGASAFRRAAGAWSARPRALPIHDCALADGPSVFEITGGDPQLLLCEENSSSAISLSSGVYEIVLQAESFPKSLRRPILYIDEGNGFSENRKNILAKTGDNIWRARFAVDRHAKALRLERALGSAFR
ncbi:hypothetical protein [Methylocystis parvus]|uniref:hypothetical protein n=1 Tax=Methylocystis parvus TaxID=134 RepID=UPI003C709880